MPTNFMTTIGLLLLTTGAVQISETSKSSEVSATVRLGKPRFLNLGRVFALAYSPDGKLLASGAWDGSIRLWEGTTERPSLDGHKGPVRRLAFSPDGKALLSAGKELGLCLWDVRTGKLTKSLGSSKNDFADAGFSPDGKYLAGISHGTLYVWDGNGNQLWKQGGDRIHTRMAFRRDGTLSSIYLMPLGRGNFANFSARTHLGTWACASGKESKTEDLGQNQYMAYSAVFGPEARPVALHTGPDIRQSAIRYIHTRRGEPAGEILLTYQSVSVMCISPDRRMLALTGDSWGSEPERAVKFIRVIEIATGRERCRFQTPDKGQTCLAFSPDSRILASGSLDTTVLLWDLTGGAVKEQRNLPSADLDKLWNELKSDDAAAAYRAEWQLVAAAKQAVLFLAKHLQPVPAPDLNRLTSLVRDLADKRFARRQQAAAELAKFGELAESALLTGLGKGEELEVRRRIEDLLKRLEQLSPERLRTYRAVETLEHMGTPEALALLREVSKGFSRALLTRVAADACRRLAAAPLPAPELDRRAGPHR